MFHLSKTPGKDFVILNLTDPQLSIEEWAPDHVRGNILRHTVKTLIDRVHPDLITCSGDYSYAGQIESYAHFAELMESYGIPWAPVWGNHDNQGGAEEIKRSAAEFLKSPHCLFEHGDPALGSGNYVIRIEEDGRPVEGLIMMDSHDTKPFVDENGKYQWTWACLTPEQIAWYTQTVADLNAAGCPDNMIITHIPPYCYRTAFAQASRAADPFAVKPEDSADPALWAPEFAGAFGVKYDPISSYIMEDGVIDAVLKAGTTRHILVGHDHTNNYAIPYHGTWLIFSLKTGIGCYANRLLNGGTVFTVDGTGIKEFHHEFVDISAFPD